MATPPKPLLTIARETSILDGIVLVEQPDKQKLWSLINSPLIKSKWDLAVYSQKFASQNYTNEKEQLQKYYNNYTEEDRGVKTRYARARHGFGRAYPVKSLGLTSISRLVRNELIKGVYMDYDLKNAQPVILQNICRENNISCPKLDEYCNNREGYLQKMVEGTGNQITRDQAKKFMLRIFFKGTWWGFMRDNDLKGVVEPDCVSAFIAEMKTITTAIKSQNTDLWNTIRKSKGDDASNLEGAFLSLYIQEHEIRIVGKVIEWLLKNVVNNNVLTYEYDGVKILMLDIVAYLNRIKHKDFKIILNKITLEITGFVLEWENKKIVGFDEGSLTLVPLPLKREEQVEEDKKKKQGEKELNKMMKEQKAIQDHNEVVEEIRRKNDESGDDAFCCGVIENDEEGATLIINKIKRKLIYCNDEVYMRVEGVWSRDYEAVKKMMMDYILHCNLEKSPAVGVLTPYSKNVRGAKDLMTAVFAILQRVNTDNKLYDKFFTTTKGRLCFKDGVLDMRPMENGGTAVFVPYDENYELPASFGDYYTTIRIDRNFGECYASERDEETITLIRDNIIKPLFGENWERVLTYWSRAMFGHLEDKSWLLYTGNRNCGKGVINDLNETAFGAYHANINSDNFITKMNRQAECEKELQFALPAQFSRWALTQEAPDVVDKRCRINSSLIKLLNSGGDRLRGKVNYAVKSVQFIFAPTLVMLCNDHLGFTQDDVLQTCNEIVAVSQFISQEEYDEKIRNNTPAMERFRIRDPNIKSICKTDKYANSWIKLLLEYYRNIKGENIRDTKPDEDDKDSGLGDEGDLESFILNNFSIDKDKTDLFMSSADIHEEFVRLKNGKVSSKKIGASLSKVFALKSSTRGNPRARGFIGIKLKEYDPTTPNDD